MKFTDAFILDKKMEDAKNIFNAARDSLDEMEEMCESKTGGKTPESMVADRKMTFIWTVALTVFFCFSRPFVDGAVFPIAVLAAIALLVALFKDNSAKNTYMEEIFEYKNEIAQLKERVQAGRAAMGEEYKKFNSLGENGWEYPLEIGNSMLVEMDILKNTVNEKGKAEESQLNQVKNILFFANSILLTIISGITFSGVSEAIANKFALSNETEMIVRIISFMAACIAEGLIAKWMWGKTNLEVTNKTLWAFIPALPLYVGISIIASIIAYLITAVIELAIVIIMFISVVACLGCVSCMEDATYSRW